MYYDMNIFSPLLLKIEIADAIESRGNIPEEDQDYLVSRMVIISKRKGRLAVQEVGDTLRRYIKNEELLNKINKFS